ncbi:hypothetical protein M2480_002264 [Parabacteroides sp. PFB2-12]|uniref:hypothetical protein n=1 Tax=unclassified Parabacteroides TaxID=2649774 RepID=UPI0024759837|nr:MULTISPECIES: hypothetical protein [unclassified Parabacteroides]MDH6343911.1 hypothetical protein [Parabacteroides sp. PM6-13]MDH6391273.1 hypothetical protein [Parabacteroides sp. PFB2-12]
MIDIRQEENTEHLFPILQKDTGERLQELSGKIWTDFHAHDPGVTLNDVLNYVLTDVDYKLHYNLEDYLNTEQQPFSPEEIGLLSSTAISDSEPITPAEYTQLFLAQIQELKTLKMSPARSGRLGVYDIHAQAHPSVPPGDYESIREKIKELYYNHRNLCEELDEVELSVATRTNGRQHLPDINAYLDNHLSDYPQGSYRAIFNHYPARHDLPRIYGVNDWGISKDSPPERVRQAEQLKAYLGLFDELVEMGLRELQDAPRWFRLDTQLPHKRGVELKKKLLNNLDKLYGVNSHPDFLLTPEGEPEEPEKALTRRTEFLKQVPHWGKDKHKASFLNAGEYWGLERYIRTLLGLTNREELTVVEHIFFRHLTEPIRSENYVPPVFPIELSLTVLVYGETPRMKDNRFREGLETLIYQRIPAHLDVTVQWLDKEESARFKTLYEACKTGFAECDAEHLKEFIIQMRERK